MNNYFKYYFKIKSDYLKNMYLNYYNLGIYMLNITKKA